LSATTCNAQSQFSSDQLIGTTWVPVIQPPVCIDTISYTRTKKIMKSYFPKTDRTVVSYNNYYLSDTIPSAFDHSQVNKTSFGNYMIFYNPYMDVMTFHGIIKLDIADGTLILERYNSLKGCFEPVEYKLVKSQ
jgi:hypothetical protein